MLDYYTFIVAIVVCTALITMATVVGNATLPRRTRNLFLCLFASIAAASVCEWGGVMLDGAGPQVIPVIATLKTLEFSIAPSLAVMYAAVLGPKDRGVKVALGLAVAHALLECALAPFGVVFYVDVGGTYHHGVAYALYIAAYVSSALFLLLAVARFSRSFQYRNRGVPWLVVIFILASILAQMHATELRIAWLVLVIGGLMLYTFFCSVVQQTDALTRLLNRHSFESAVSLLKTDAVFLLFDVDDFKAVNDTFGHSAGDDCLRLVGKAIFDTFGQHGSCFRTGGDEFCVVLTSKPSDADELVRAFDARLAALRVTHPELPSVSVGQAAYDPAAGDATSAYEAADALMYTCKQGRKH